MLASNSMFTFNKYYSGIAILVFMTEVMIALFVKDTFVRPYLGDVLAVILIYCVVKSFLKWSVLSVAIVVLLFAFTIEFLQLIRIVDILGLDTSPIARTVIGTSFSWGDLIAYVAGIGIVLLVEGLRLRLLRHYDGLP